MRDADRGADGSNQRPSFADIRTKVAELGGDAKITFRDPPKTGEEVDLVIVQRVESLDDVQASTPGLTTCILCGATCVTTHETQPVLASGERFAACLSCANSKLPRRQ